jgi:hypothetical protein
MGGSARGPTLFQAWMPWSGVGDTETARDSQAATCQIRFGDLPNPQRAREQYREAGLACLRHEIVSLRTARDSCIRVITTVSRRAAPRDLAGLREGGREGGPLGAQQARN